MNTIQEILDALKTNVNTDFENENNANEEFKTIHDALLKLNSKSTSEEKYLIIILEIQDGENRHKHKVLHTTKAKNINFAAEKYAAGFYSERTGRYDDWWEFNHGCIAVRLYTVNELTTLEYNILSKYLNQ